MSHSRKPRIAMYSHDTMGLGHIRRNILVAQALSKSNLEPNILLLSGAQEAESFALPAGVDRTILPSLYKEQNGQYRSRLLRMPLDEIISLRRKILHAAIAAFDPDLMIVDGVPWGAVGELDSTLEYLRSQAHTSCVLAMRDIWDEPEAISREWQQRNNWDAIRRYYDQVWIYGDPSVYDAIKEYSIQHEIASKIKYTGYLDQVARLELVKHKGHPIAGHGIMPGEGHFVLCMVGGGQDGIDLAEAFVDAELPQDISGVIITGPYMDLKAKEKLLDLAERKKHIRIFDFVLEPNVLLQQALCIVSMGGYNTVCSIMSFAKHALVVPRVFPRKEQLIRAERLQSLGILKLIHPDSLIPEDIATFVKNSIGKQPPNTHVNMNGLSSVLSLAESLLIEKQFCSSDCQVSGAY